MIRIAASQFGFTKPSSWAEWRAAMATRVGEAVDAGAQLLVFPEYGGLELTALVAPRRSGEDDATLLRRQVEGLQPFLPDYRAWFQEQARRAGITILAPTVPVLEPDGRVLNTAYLASPDARIGVQTKLIPTCYEREMALADPGQGLTVFATPIGPVGIAICYDVELPLIARHLAEAGAGLILCPSCTELATGWNRVRIGGQARALENQCPVIHAVTVGEAPWCPAVDVSVGAAGVYLPPDLDLPPTGILAQGAMSQPQWLIADLDPAAVALTRTHGQVRPFLHWPEQAERVVGNDEDDDEEGETGLT